MRTACALAAVIVCVEDPLEAGARYARFAGLLPQRANDFVRLDTARGRVMIGTRAACAAVLGAAPAAPALAGYALACDDPPALGERLTGLGCAVARRADDLLSGVLPNALGGAWLIGTADALAAWDGD